MISISKIKIINKKFGELNIDGVGFYDQPKLIVSCIEQLQQENQQLKILIENLKLGVTLNEEQEKLLDKILFNNERKGDNNG